MNNTMIVVGGAILIALIVISLFVKRKPKGSSSNTPLSEVEVYLAYGRTKEAEAVLDKYLISNPGDQKALNLLKQVKLARS